MKKEIINYLFEIGAVKFGKFTLRSGIISPMYLDLRVLVSHPKTIKKVADIISDTLEDLKFDLISGIPYTALPIASIVSVKKNIPMIYCRKEVKKYGTKKRIEGQYKKGEICVVIDDLITNGDSKFEAVEPFENEGLIIRDFIVLIDREQGGKERLKKRGYNLHSIITITQILESLLKDNKITGNEYQEALDFTKNNQVF